MSLAVATADTVAADDPRAGLPSASGLERFALCPGSWALECTQPPEPENADAATGTRIHEALAKCFAATPWRAAADDGTVPLEIAEGLTDDEAETFARCVRQTVEVVSRWAVTGPFDLRTEQREWLIDGRFERILSGQYDLLILQPGRALVIDFKTGRGEQPESAANLQLRALAVLVAANETDIREVAVALVQPWASAAPALCAYSVEDLDRATDEVLTILANAAAPGAPRVPGEKQCRWCRAKAACPEAHAQVSALATLETRGEIETADLLRLLDLCGPVERVIASLRARAKRMLEADIESVPGWTLEPGAARRIVSDAEAAFTALSDVLQPAQFTACCTVKISELETLYRKTRGLSVKEARAEFDARLNGSIETKQNAPSLARVKQK